MTTALSDQQYRAELQRAGTAFAGMVGDMAPDAAVPSCPGWDVRELVGHLGGIHGWASAIVRGAGPKAERPRPDGGDLADWYLEQLALLQQSFDDIPADAKVWTFGQVKSPSFWMRRQAHETAMHLCDAQLASGTEMRYVDVLAADSISELFEVMAPRRQAKAVLPLAGPITFTATDTGDQWSVRPSAQIGVVDVTHTGPELAGSEQADCTVTATTQQLALGLWRRTSLDQWKIDGDRARVESFVNAPLTP